MSPSVPIEVLPFDGEPLTTPRALAATLGYTQRMVRYWTDEGCPFYDVDGLRRFRESEVRRWLRKQGRLSKAGSATLARGQSRVSFDDVVGPGGPSRSRSPRGQRGGPRFYASEAERPAGELNSALGSRNPQSGHTGQAKRKDRREYKGARREYLRNYQREWIAKRRAEWFVGKSCVDCGSSERLEIDHVDPELKIHHAVWSWAKERREAELAKCVVRCNACHMERHGRTPGGAHGGKLRYESGCRCLECVEGQRERDRVKRRHRLLRAVSETEREGGRA